MMVARVRILRIGAMHTTSVLDLYSALTKTDYTDESIANVLELLQSCAKPSK